MLAIDFDETLNFSKRNQNDFVPNYDLINILKSLKFSILTARHNNKKNRTYINKFLREFGLSPENIYYTNGLGKGPFMKKYNLDYLVDDKEYQINSAINSGFDGDKPEDFISKNKRVSKLKNIFLKISEKLNAEPVEANDLADKSWYQTTDGNHDWYYWKDKPTDLKNLPLNIDEALQEFVEFAYEKGLETLPSCEGHSFGEEKAEKIYNKLLKDEEKIKNDGLEVINTENKEEKIIFKDPDYSSPFDDPDEIKKEYYSGYIGVKIRDEELLDSLFNKLKKSNTSVRVDKNKNTLNIYVDSEDKGKQKEAWKMVTDLFKKEVEKFEKKAESLNALYKFATSKQQIQNLGYPELFASFFIEKLGRNAYIIAKWVKEIINANRGWSNFNPFYYDLIDGLSDSKITEFEMYQAAEKGIEAYEEYLTEKGFEYDKSYDLESDKRFLKEEIKHKFNSNYIFRSDLIKEIISGEVTNLSEYKKLNYYDATNKFISKKISNEDNIVLKYEDGYKWVNFKNKCLWLGGKMRNCGSSYATSLSRDKTMLALLDENDLPHVVLTYSAMDALVSNIEGKASQPPKEEYHSYILDLLDKLNVKILKKENKSDDLYLKSILANYDSELELIKEGLFYKYFKIKLNDNVLYTNVIYILTEEEANKVYNYIKEDHNNESFSEIINFVIPERKDKIELYERELGVKYKGISAESTNEFLKGLSLEKRSEKIKNLLIKISKDPKVGTGKKPKGSGRRLYTDENPKDTCPVKFTSANAIRETFSTSCFKSKSHARQSQIINLVHQRVRAAYQNAKDPKVKARLKRALKYAEERKEQSKEKTKRLRNKK